MATQAYYIISKEVEEGQKFNVLIVFNVIAYSRTHKYTGINNS